MNEDDLRNILSVIRANNEIPYIEVKDSLSNKEQIGKTLSALSNSASYYEKEYGYMIWGIENETWKIIGTTFDLEKAKQGNSGFIYPQIIQAFNYSPQIDLYTFSIDECRIVVLRIKNCGNQALYFNKIAYIRTGEVNDELSQHPAIFKSIVNKNTDWSAQVPDGSSLAWLDDEALQYLRAKYFELNQNKDNQIEDIQLLNMLSLIDKKNRPNNAGLLFLGKPSILKDIFGDRNKITWTYRDELNGIEERLSVDEESLPLIFGIQNILDKINTFNTTLQDIDLFRNDVLQYDRIVVEEIVVNAIAHRDWENNLWIEIVQTPTSLEVRNPGKFRADLNEVLLENKRPEYLNPTLADFLKKMHLMEKEGGGLRKAWTVQIKKGLTINLRYKNDGSAPRVDFILSGKVKDIAFARYMFTAKDLSQDQVVILDKINSGKNILGKDVTEDEYLKVQKLVRKTGQRGISLKIEEHLLKKSNKYINSFSNTHTSSDTSKEIILDYAKKNNEFTTAEVYGILSGKSKVWVRVALKEMVDDGRSLKRVRRGVYSKVKTIPTKLTQ